MTFFTQRRNLESLLGKCGMDLELAQPIYEEYNLLSDAALNQVIEAQKQVLANLKESMDLEAYFDLERSTRIKGAEGCMWPSYRKPDFIGLGKSPTVKAMGGEAVVRIAIAQSLLGDRQIQAQRDAQRAAQEAKTRPVQRSQTDGRGKTSAPQADRYNVDSSSLSDFAIKWENRDPGGYEAKAKATAEERKRLQEEWQQTQELQTSPKASVMELVNRNKWYILGGVVLLTTLIRRR